jgi:hypothetical protein
MEDFRIQNMTSACRRYILDTIHFSEELINIAKGAYSNCDDEHCLVLFGIILDSAFKMRREALKRFKYLEKGKDN